MTRQQFDLFVIGGGSGGVRAARMAAQCGARVALQSPRHGRHLRQSRVAFRRSFTAMPHTSANPLPRRVVLAGRWATRDSTGRR